MVLWESNVAFASLLSGAFNLCSFTVLHCNNRLRQKCIAAGVIAVNRLQLGPVT